MYTRPNHGSISHRPAAGWDLLLVALLLAGCAEREIPHPEEQRLPELELIQTDPGAAEIKIAGPRGLRGLQARLTYDAALLRVTGVEAGADSSRLDRLFHASLESAQGNLTVGLSDTRRILLPARGSLIRFTFEAVGDGVSVQVALEEPLGADDVGAAVRLEPPSIEVKF